MLSDLVRHHVRDAQGHTARLGDLAVDLGAAEYPVVMRLLVPGDGGAPRALPCPATLDPAQGLVVEALDAAMPLDADALAALVLLRRDVQDALLLDLAQERAVRANDLVLAQRGAGLALVGADVSATAVLRRLSHGLLRTHGPGSLLDWREVEFLRGTPGAVAAGRAYHRRVTRLHPSQIARLADAVPYLHAAELLALLADPLAADVLESMLPERQVQVIAELTPPQATGILAEMAPDAAADLLGRLAIADAAHLLETLPPERALPIQDLLRFPPDTAGGIMTNAMVYAPVDRTVGDVIAYIRDELAHPDFVYFVYLVDDPATRRLCGVVTLRELLLADHATPIEQVMTADLQVVGPLEPADAVARRIADYGLNALPVVAADGSLLGIVTVDAAMVQILPVAWRDRLPRVFS